jgi:hypothetical protein
MAQEAPVGIVPSQNRGSNSPGASCSPVLLQSATQLTFRQRACFYEARMMAPSLILRASVVAGYGQLRNNPRVTNEGWSEFGYRFGVFYARQTGRNVGELVAGYLNHEDPRPHISQEHGFLRRSQAAFRSVLVTKEPDGSSRPALAPIAGSFGSGMMGLAFYRNTCGLANGFERTGFTYSTYFATALVREFQPDISVLASRLLRKKKQD